jgi:hypothetical protein
MHRTLPIGIAFRLSPNNHSRRSQGIKPAVISRAHSARKNQTTKAPPLRNPATLKNPPIPGDGTCPPQERGLFCFLFVAVWTKRKAPDGARPVGFYALKNNKIKRLTMFPGLFKGRIAARGLCGQALC